MLALYISLLDTEEQISKFEHIYTKYRGLMFYTAKGVLQDSYLAEDAVHETFLDIIRIIDSIRANNEKELSQFLRVLTHHKAVDMVRKCTRQKKSDTEIEDFDLSKSDVNVETIVLDKIDYENMLLRVQSMDEKYKTPLLLKVQGYKVSEIADFLNISPGNVKVRLHRARKIILTGLEENSEVSRSSSTYYGHTHEFSGTANIKSGTTYKLVTTATVTRNGSSETVSNTFEKKC